MRITALIFAASLLMPISDELPDLNVSESCRGAAQIAIADAQSFDACMKEESSARDQLRQSWQSFKVSDRVNCAAEASSQGLASYVELLTCLQISSDVEPEKRTQLKGARRK